MRETLVAEVEPSRLAQVPLFSALTPGELAVLALRVSVERYGPGVVIVGQGEAPDKLYVVAEGEVEVLVHDREGGERQVAVLEAPSYFGEIALLGDDAARRNATVRTRGTVELYSLHKEDFRGLLRAHPRLAEDVGHLAQARVEQTREILLAVGGEAPRPDTGVP
jgi:CRP-like cAMP-binding protein